MCFAVKLHIEVRILKRLLSALLVLSFALMLSACSSKNGGEYAEVPSEKVLTASEIKNEAVRTLVGDGRLVNRLEYDLPTTLGLIKGIADEAEYTETVYDELPAKVRNVSKFILDDILETEKSIIAQTGSYTFVQLDGSSLGDKVYIIADDSKRVYRVMIFTDGQETYEMLSGLYTDFSNSYFYKNKEYAKHICRKMTVKEETNEILVCRLDFPVSEKETVGAVYNESGEMLYCFDKSDSGEKYFNRNFAEISSDDAEAETEEFAQRIKRKYEIELKEVNP